MTSVAPPSGNFAIWKLKPANPGFLETQMNRIHELETK